MYGAIFLLHTCERCSPSGMRERRIVHIVCVELFSGKETGF